MKASTRKMQRLVKLLVATVVAAAIAVPAAGARTDAGMGRVDADVWGVSEYAQPGPAVKGENYYARGFARCHQYCAARDSRRTSAPVADTSAGESFPWSDAGIGVGIALGLTALAGGGVLIVRRQRDRLRTS